MSKRAWLLLHVAGVVAILGGLYEVWTTWAVAATSKPGLAELLGLATRGKGMAFAEGVTGTLGDDFSLPRLALTEPLIWFGVALLLTAQVVGRYTRLAAASEHSSDRGAFVACPTCDHLVPVSLRRCPLCHAQLFAPWSNASLPGGGPSGTRD